MVNCSTLEVQQPKIDDRQTQFHNEVQSAGLESMNGASASVGMSVVCQKGTVIENTMLSVLTGFWSAPVTNASDEVAMQKICADFQYHKQFWLFGLYMM